MGDFLFSTTSSIGNLESHSLRLLHEELAQKKPSYSTYRITRVVHYKEKSFVGHELLVLYIQVVTETDQREIIRCIERRAGNRPVGCSSSERDTVDSIRAIDPTFDLGSYHHISTTVCSTRQPLTVMEMCDIATFVRNAASVYSLSKATHCYWFCAAILAQLNSRGYVKSFTKGDQYKKKARFRTLVVVKDDAVKESLRPRPSFRKKSPGDFFPDLSTRATISLSLPTTPAKFTSDCKFIGHKHAVSSIRYTPNGLCLVSGGSDTTVRLWSIEYGHPVLWALYGHEKRVSSVSISPDSLHIASVSDDATMRVWDLKRGVATSDPRRNYNYPLTSVTFSPDGSELAASSLDGTMHLWSAKSSTDAQTFLRHNRGPALSVCGNNMQRHTAPGGQMDQMTSVVWNAVGGYIVSGSYDGILRLWSRETMTELGKPLLGHLGSINSVDVAPDGLRAVSGSADKTLLLWDLANKRALGVPLRGHKESVVSVAFSPDGRWVISGSLDKTVRIWDTQSALDGSAEIFKISVSSPVTCVAWSPLGDGIAAGCDDGVIQTWRMVS